MKCKNILDFTITGKIILRLQRHRKLVKYIYFMEIIIITVNQLVLGANWYIGGKLCIKWTII